MSSEDWNLSKYFFWSKMIGWDFWACTFQQPIISSHFPPRRFKASRKKINKAKKRSHFSPNLNSLPRNNMGNSKLKENNILIPLYHDERTSTHKKHTRKSVSSMVVIALVCLLIASQWNGSIINSKVISTTTH